MIFSFLRVPAQGIHKKSYCFYIQERFSLRKLAEILDVKYQGRKRYKNNSHSWFDGNFYYAPISKIETKNYKGKVYNLEVEGQHSYLTEAAVVHNCGDMMKMYLKIRRSEEAEEGGEGKGAVIEDAKFETLGCGAAIAMSSRVTEMIKGKTVEEAKKLKPEDVAAGFDLPKQKYHCSILGIEALQEAIKKYKEKKKVSSTN